MIIRALRVILRECMCLSSSHEKDMLSRRPVYACMDNPNNPWMTWVIITGGQGAAGDGAAERPERPRSPSFPPHVRQEVLPVVAHR